MIPSMYSLYGSVMSVVTNRIRYTIVIQYIYDIQTYQTLMQSKGSEAQRIPNLLLSFRFVSSSTSASYQIPGTCLLLDALYIFHIHIITTRNMFFNYKFLVASFYGLVIEERTTTKLRMM
ncbi:hypothetical protein P175DRAFT_0204251 [Aspergillus ochraceoroseus IBT 24754]|uniref:Uncharacterized protein n=1 Tax=Aspergillus ochraceoroseus IBT 24754 TaxID=1392256 RepID=A0A2T5M030_9EURO|nr:uncharacterized protein P175DRAFT_0204251 [Aspergillus ochraceoroseus IBT 24754]PTU21890.1 hypothetical protein P175DRAFT_0204251 [Aspergillus ochraceoroseus IBT 24754]